MITNRCACGEKPVLRVWKVQPDNTNTGGYMCPKCRKAAPAITETAPNMDRFADRAAQAWNEWRWGTQKAVGE